MIRTRIRTFGPCTWGSRYPVGHAHGACSGMFLVCLSRIRTCGCGGPPEPPSYLAVLECLVLVRLHRVHASLVFCGLSAPIWSFQMSRHPPCCGQPRRARHFATSEPRSRPWVRDLRPQRPFSFPPHSADRFYRLDRLWWPFPKLMWRQELGRIG